MKQKMLSLCAIALMGMAQAYGGVTLTVPEVSIAPGGTSYVVINFDLGTPAYTAYQFDIAYPQGISSESDEEGNPAFTEGEVYAQSHSVSSVYTAKGLDRFQCFSLSSAAFTAQSGTLLTLPIKAKGTLAEGTYQATIAPIEFVQTDATPDRPEAVTFNITVSKSLVLDETSIAPPAIATDVNVRVKRTINAGEWSTICLPFAMTAEQVTAAFGSDVQIADFTGCEATYDEAKENIVALNVNFEDVTEMEANHPYVIRTGTDIAEFTISGVDIAPADEGELQVDRDELEYTYTVGKKIYTGYMYNSFVGTYEAQTEVPENALFLSGNQFWYSKGLTKMKAFRGYFEFYDVLSSVEEGNYSRRITMVFLGGETTGISATLNDNVEMRSDEVYDLQGRRLEPSVLKKGLYVKNGKKTVIK